MSVYEIFEMLTSNLWIYGGAFLLLLSILVFVHEWGHYIVAKLCGVKVEIFSIGFGKELFGFQDKSGTRWKFSLIPLGGYVKMFGDTDPASAGHTENVKNGHKVRKMSAKEREQAFFAKAVWKRALIVFAGPAVNYLFAIILLAGLYMTQGQPVSPPTAAAIVGGSSAEKYGFQPHDLVLSIDGKTITSFEDIRREIMVSLDIERHFVVQRAGETIDLYAIPEKVERTDRFGFKSSIGLLGLISPRHAVPIENVSKIDGKVYQNIDDKKAALQERMGKTLTLEITRPDGTDTLTVQPVAEFNTNMNDPDSPEYNALFLSDTEPQQFIQYNPLTALQKSVRETFVITRSTIEALGQIIMGFRSPTELGGIIRIGAFAGDMAQQGIVALVLFMALLSVNLGFINLMPIPLLDGGHLVFYFVESVLGRPIPDYLQEYAFRAGLVFLVALMAFANLNDLVQLLIGAE